MSKPIHWGFLGAGTVAHRFACGLRRVPETRVVAVASRSAPRAESFARRWGVPRWYADYDRLVGDPQVDVVYVATPNHRHYRDVLRALEAGKAVLCEKPFAMNAGEAAEMIDVARRRRLFCMEAMWMRFLPAMQRLNDLVGQLGELQMVTAQLGHALDDAAAPPLFEPGLGGGALRDLGVYLVAFAIQWFGEPTEVEGFQTLGPTGVDDHAALLLRFPRGQLGCLTASLRLEGTNDAVLIGERGRIRVHAPLYRPDRLTVSGFRRQTQPAVEPAWPWLENSRLARYGYRALRTLARPLFGRGDRRVVVPFRGNGYNYEAAEVVRCLRAGCLESPRIPWEQTLQIQRVLDAVPVRAGRAASSDMEGDP